MWSLLYQALLWLSYPVVRLRLYLRARKTSAYGLRINERFGKLPPEIAKGALWFHCVSAGETIAAAPLIKQMREQLQRQAVNGGGVPVPILVTTMTPTGSEQVQRLFGDTVAHCYAPYDYRFAVQRFLTQAQPIALVIVETEIWPNLIGLSKARGLPVMLVNARLSSRSARGYARVAGLIRDVLRQLDWIACQYPADRERFSQLGAHPDRLSCVGNMKFDAETSALNRSVEPTTERALRLLEQRRRDAALEFWVAGSTHAGEETHILAAQVELLKRHPQLCLILVPRHPERFDTVYSACKGLPTMRLSSWLGGESTASQIDAARVVLVDAMGMLGALYGQCNVAFIGGSLVPVGGHNPIEAARASVPMLMGSHRFNFAAVCEAFAASDALIEVADARSIAECVGGLLSDPLRRVELGQAAQQVVSEQAGATQLLVDGLTNELASVLAVSAATKTK